MLDKVNSLIELYSRSLNSTYEDMETYWREVRQSLKKWWRAVYHESGKHGSEPRSLHYPGYNRMVVGSSPTGSIE